MYQYDVILIYDYMDKEEVRSIAERLQKDGVRVWFDEWVIKSGDKIREKTEEAMDGSRVLLFCISANAFYTNRADADGRRFRLHDAVNTERRIIPLRLDEVPVRDSLAHFRSVDWSPAHREHEYPKLLEVCLPPELSLVPMATASDEKEFVYDVFLSHDRRDREVVRAIAERLRGDGLKVWFEEWLRPGDNIPAKSIEGLEASRGLLLCLSEHAFGTDWAMLEATTFRFRDPLNQERRFIPLRLDDVPVQPSLANYIYINWLASERDQEYPKLLQACSPASTEGFAQALSEDAVPAARVITLASCSLINAFDFSRDGKLVLTACNDNTVGVWDAGSGKCLRVFKGHTGSVSCVAWSPDQTRALSGSDDHSLLLWTL